MNCIELNELANVYVYIQELLKNWRNAKSLEESKL